jgi:hypothetical protein
MPREARKIVRSDIMPIVQYAKERSERRRALLPVKKIRRVSVGPYATFYFENFDTMWLQVHEMLYIEKGGEEQIEDELSAYNPLIPQKGELVATVMFEIDDEGQRNRVLRQLTNIEASAFLDIGGDKIKATFEADVDRTAEDGKTSSVHFLMFGLTPAQVAKFKDASKVVMLGFTHPNYGHLAVLGSETRAELAKDLG